MKLKIKKYNLYDGDKLIGTFELLDTPEKYKVTLIDNLIHFNIPINFWNGYDAGKREFTGKVVFGWIQDRVFPPNRQNINGILKSMGIAEYDELAIFLGAKGKFVCDTFRIEEVE